MYGSSSSQAGVVGESTSFHAVYGQAHDINSAGIFGANDNTSGGFGVAGVTPNGVGVAGTGLTGVRGTAYGAGTTAVEVNNGAFKVTGAGVGSNTAVFVHVKTAANTCGGDDGNISAINNPYANEDPNAILIVTPAANAGTNDPQTTGSTSVYYYPDNGNPSCPFVNGHWAIYSTSSIPDGCKFNVMVIKP